MSTDTVNLEAIRERLATQRKCSHLPGVNALYGGYEAPGDIRALLAHIEDQQRRIKELEAENDEAREELRMIKISIASTTAAYKALGGNA